MKKSINLKMKILPILCFCMAMSFSAQAQIETLYYNDFSTEISMNDWILNDVLWNSSNNGRLDFTTINSYAIMPMLPESKTGLAITISAVYSNLIYLHTSPDGVHYTNQGTFSGDNPATKSMPDGTLYVKFVAHTVYANVEQLMSVTITCTCTGSVPATGVTLNRPSVLLKPTQSMQLTATVLPVCAVNKNVTWSSNNTGVATVNAVGLVNAVAAGTAMITATTASGGFTAQCTVTVQNFVTRYVKPVASGIGDGSSWANAVAGTNAFMQHIINNADQVWIATGTYPLSATLEMKEGVNVYGGFYGNETALSQRQKSDVNGNGTIEPWEFTYPTILDGQGARTILIQPAAFTVETVWDGLTITQGYGGGGANIKEKGKLENCIITKNRAGGVLTLHGFQYTATAGYGGGVSGNGTVSRCLISQNEAHSGFDIFYNPYYSAGGGVAGSTVMDCIIENNAANSGGGVSGGVVIRSIIRENRAHGVRMQSNYPHNGGGGLRGSTAYHCLIINNTTPNVGAGAHDGDYINCTFVNNATGVSGGGLYSGAATNCIFWNNYAPTSPQATATVSYSAIQGGGVTGTGNISVYDDGYTAMFVDAAADNYQLTPCSPAVNTGNNAALSGGNNNFDLAGNPRIFGAIVDMGAYELQSAGLIIPAKPTISQAGSLLTSSSATGNQWYSNGAPIGGAISSTHNIGTQQADFYVVVTSNDGCTAVSNVITTIPESNMRYVKANGSSISSGRSWATASNNIQAMINELSALGGGQVWIAGGNYKAYQLEMKENVHIYGGFLGNETAISQRQKSDLDGNGTVEPWEFTHATVLNGQNLFSVLNQANNFTVETTCDGLTITNGQSYGAYLRNNAKLMNCMISNNNGHGIYFYTGSGIISHCHIYGNSENGISGSGTATTATHCIIKGNSIGLYDCKAINCLIANNSRYGISNDGGSGAAGTYINCTVVNNDNYGVHQPSTGYGTFINCIFWNNNAGETQIASSNINITYSAIQGGFTGTGNINLSEENDAVTGPMFVNPAAGNYQLQSCSPCIDKGNNSALTSEDIIDLAGNPRIYNSLVDMGAYEAQDIVCPFVPVTDIINVPTTTKATIPLTLTGKVTPVNATHTTIVWSVTNQGTTGATISSAGGGEGWILNTTAEGTAMITATIVNGLGENAGENYTKTFVITVTCGGGDGSSTNPFKICNEQDLVALASTVNSGGGTATAGKYYILMNDLDFDGYNYGNTAGWMPIGNYTTANRFRGNFDGNGKMVKNIFINRTTTDEQGLFGCIQGATIKNLGVVNCNITGNGFVSGLVGYDAGGTNVIENCYVTGAVKGIDDFAGGIASYTTAATIVRNCYTTATVEGASYIGGVVGYNEGTIENCYAAGNVSGTTNYIGGVAGRNANVIRNCVAANHKLTATTATNIYRITGFSGTATLQNNYAYQNMVITTDNGSTTATPGGASGANATYAALTSFAFYNTGSNWYNNTPWSIAIGASAEKKWNICDNGVKLPFMQWEEGVDCNISFIPVTDIAGVPTTAQIGIPLTLTGTIIPTIATNQTIVWSVFDAGDTEATLTSGNILNATTPGTVIILATIANGLGENASEDYTQTIAITVIESSCNSGDGSLAHPFGICTEEDLFALATTVNAGGGAATAGKYYILKNDLDFAGFNYGSSAGWTPIGLNFDNYRFQGNFDGNGKVVKNIFINRTTDNQALFNYIQDATIKNLGLENCNITGDSYVAGLVVNTIGTNVIENCYVTGTVKATGGPVGGIVGATGSATIIKNCYVTASVTGGAYYTGGLVGYNAGTIENCYATGDISTTGERIGGLAGHNSGTIRSCVAANNNITATTTTAINRITGYNAGTLQSNHAFQGMVVQNNSGVINITPGLNNLAGVSEILSTLTSYAFYMNVSGTWYGNTPWSIAIGADAEKKWRICNNDFQLPFLQWQKDIICSVIPVTNITGVPTTITAGVPLTLTGTVAPSNASNQTIVWSVWFGAGTGAVITSGNILNVGACGTVIVRATITDGLAAGEDYIKDFTITVNLTTTTFSGLLTSYCAGTFIPALPDTSTNGVTGTWSPAINNTQTTTYTFTPNAGQCATTAQITITLNSIVTPTFSGIATEYCAGASIPELPTTSNNGVTGMWSPAINNTATTTYTFTPNADQCAINTQITIAITPNTTPAFSGVTTSYCAGASIPALPVTSTNGVTGTWSPAINNTTTTIYTFTPTAGQCATTVQITITVNPIVTPTFSGITTTYCAGASIPALPVTSTNGVTGTWSPAINNTQTTTYTFTPATGQCANTAQITITINPIVTPTFSGIVMEYNFGATIPALPTTSTNGITGTWSPAINNTQTTTYTFTPTAGQCATTTQITIIINPPVPIFIAGKVTREDQTPFTAGTVSLYKVQSTSQYSFEGDVFINDIGNYLFPDVPPGDYIIKVISDDYEKALPTYYGNTENWYEATVVTVTDIPLQDIDITIISLPDMNGNGAISGYVYEEEGEKKGISNTKGEHPAPDIAVYLQTLNSTVWKTIAQVITNKEGYYRFDNLSAGNYRVIIDIPGLNMIDIPIINLGDGEEVDEINYTITNEMIIPTVGIGTFSLSSIQIYPNPTTGELRIENGELKIENVEIYNIVGQKQQIIFNSQLSILNSIDISHLQAGIYFIRIQTEIGMVMRKVIKN